jgi:hypothetical protein
MLVAASWLLIQGVKNRVAPARPSSNAVMEPVSRGYRLIRQGQWAAAAGSRARYDPRRPASRRN